MSSRWVCITDAGPLGAGDGVEAAGVVVPGDEPAGVVVPGPGLAAPPDGVVCVFGVRGTMARGELEGEVTFEAGTAVGEPLDLKTPPM